MFDAMIEATLEGARVAVSRSNHHCRWRPISRYPNAVRSMCNLDRDKAGLQPLARGAPNPIPTLTRGAADKPPARSIMIAIAFFISLASLRLNNRKTLATSQTHEKARKKGPPAPLAAVDFRHQGGAVGPPRVILT